MHGDDQWPSPSPTKLRSWHHVERHHLVKIFYISQTIQTDCLGYRIPFITAWIRLINFLRKPYSFVITYSFHLLIVSYASMQVDVVDLPQSEYLVYLITSSLSPLGVKGT